MEEKKRDNILNKILSYLDCYINEFVYGIKLIIFFTLFFAAIYVISLLGHDDIAKRILIFILVIILIVIFLMIFKLYIQLVKFFISLDKKIKERKERARDKLKQEILKEVKESGRRNNKPTTNKRR